MPHGFIVRVVILLALAAPSLLLWLVLHPIANRRSISLDKVRDWLTIVAPVLLGLSVIFDAMERKMVAGAFNINFVGVLLVLTWVQRRCKKKDYGPTILNISGRESVSTR